MVVIWFWLKNQSQDGSFIAYMALAYNILTPAKAISKASYKVKTGNAAAERVLEILETTSQFRRCTKCSN